jgi:AcrR family transcriptional regulator
MIVRMPRTLPDTRMEDIAGAARSVFRRKGFRRTQVADVAAEVGISTAALYRHVESKEALFHLCFLEQLPGNDGFVATPPDGATAELVRSRLRRSNAGSTLRPALKQPALDRVAELEVIVTELYRTFQHSQELMSLIEASAADRPELHELYFRQRRGGYTDDLARYLQRGVDDGAFRPVVHPKLVAMQIREACAWFAWHRHGDPDTPAIDDDDALASIIDVHVHGLAR